MASKMMLGIVVSGCAVSAFAIGVSREHGSQSDRIVTVTGSAIGASPISGVGQAAFQSAGPQSASASAAIGCQSRSTQYPWGTAPLRTWTPINAGTPYGTPGTYASSGTRTGAPFSARLIQAFGEDVGASRQSVLLEMPDGCRRQYRSSSFTAVDAALVNSEIGRHPARADPNSYATSITEDNLVTAAQISSGMVKTYQTQHFNIMYGTKTGNFSYRHEAKLGVPWKDFINGVGKTFERVWQLSRDVVEAPMPYAAASTRKKINVYLCGTGMPFIEGGDDAGCGATGAAAVFVDAPSAQEGSTTLAHEFGHTIQFYSGGFRDRPSAGPIWETGAEWTSFVQSQTEEYFLVYYLSNLENGPIWSNNRYASFPFMSFLFEQEKTRPFLWSTWTGNRRDANGASLEDWTEAFVRQAQSAGVYASNYVSFADDMGWYGARLVAMDFLHQQALIDIRNADTAANFYTSLRPSESGTYASSSERPLRQWGTHIIPLTPNAARTSVTITGGARANSAAWRTMLVSVDASGQPRYSSMGKLDGTASATVQLNPASNEKLYLVVTATPSTYESLGWQPVNQAVVGMTFPYTAKIVGATPLTTPASKCTSVIAGSTGSNFNYNTNGRVDGGVPCA